ncbi:acetyl-CoA synthase subunit gamma [candidate division KSB1 bacterium]|nr:acetyl-CoA synthase subunit gamma [candidate division KSB1 bacterium]
MLYQKVATGSITAAGLSIPVIPSTWTFRDLLGAVGVRFNRNRMNYAVQPGLYAAGKPDKDSPVLVSANYKLSFDTLRKNLTGQNVWITVLDTKGINVWCAAGKGTFGTDELVKQVKDTGLEQIVNHRKLIVPQLGAPGIAAHLVEQQTGFKVVYGPVKAKHIPAFLNKRKLPPDFRKVRFPFFDRLILTALEFTTGLKYVIPVLAFFFLFSGIQNRQFDMANWWRFGIYSVVVLFLGFLSGAVLTPALLPYIPGRAFVFKGFITNIVVLILLNLFSVLQIFNILDLIALGCTGSAIAAFFAMNFTGASTYTSLSGVKKEMRYAVPLEIVLFAAGVILWLVGRLV